MEAARWRRVPSLRWTSQSTFARCPPCAAPARRPRGAERACRGGCRRGCRGRASPRAAAEDEAEGGVHEGEAPAQVDLVVALLDALEDLAVALVAAGEGLLRRRAVRSRRGRSSRGACACPSSTGPECTSTSRTSPEDSRWRKRKRVFCSAPAWARAASTCVTGQGVEVGDAQGAQAVPLIAVERAGGGVGVHDGPRPGSIRSWTARFFSKNCRWTSSVGLSAMRSSPLPFRPVGRRVLGRAGVYTRPSRRGQPGPPPGALAGPGRATAPLDCAGGSRAPAGPREWGRCPPAGSRPARPAPTPGPATTNEACISGCRGSSRCSPRGAAS